MSHPSSTPWQDTKPPLESSLRRGNSCRHRSLAKTHRPWNTHPDGRFTGVGTSPLSLICLAFFSPNLGMADNTPGYRDAGGIQTNPLQTQAHTGPQVENRHPRADMMDHRKIMRNEQIGQVMLFPQIHQQVQDLGLDGHIQGGHRLVRDDELRIKNQALAMEMR